MACQLCDTFISGDCGFSHLLSHMYNSPNNFIQFYRTEDIWENWKDKYELHITNPPPEKKLLN